MRDSHRAEAERLLVRAVEEEVRRSGGRSDAGVLLARGRAALDAWRRARPRSTPRTSGRWTRRRPGSSRCPQRFSRQNDGELPLLVTARCRGRRRSARTWRWARRRAPRSAPEPSSRVAGAAATVVKVTALALAGRAPPGRGARAARRRRAAAAAVADGAGGAGHPPVPRPAADAGSGDPTGDEEGRPRRRSCAAPTGARRPAGAACWSSPSGICPDPDGPFAGRRDETGADRAVGARGPRVDRDQADGGGAARRAGLGPHHARGAGRARS